MIPPLDIALERPVLETIPDLDVSSYTDSQIADITVVLGVYNMNMGKLAIYTKELEEALRLQQEYLDDIIVIINGK